MASKRCAYVEKDRCVACGACAKVCPKSVIQIWKGCYAAVRSEDCVGCGKCAGECPAGCITVRDRDE